MSKQNTIRLLLDISTFTAFLVLMEPRSSGIRVHEWLAIALSAAIVVHLLLNWSWVVDVTRRLLRLRLNGSALNYMLNWCLFTDGVLVVLSGLMISEVVVPTLGLSLPTSLSWRGLHELSTNVFLALLGLHVAMHWNWIVSTVRRIFNPNGSKGVSAAQLERKDAAA